MVFSPKPVHPFIKASVIGPCQWTGTIPPPEAAERCFSLLTKHSAPLLSLPLPQAPLSSPDEPEVITLVNKNRKNFLVVCFYRVQTFDQPKCGTGECQHWAQDWLFRAGAASLTAKLTALTSKYSSR